MTPAKHALFRCACGSVEYHASGEPILAAACYCDDCQAGARQIEALPNAGAVAGRDGGTEYLLYRKDRVVCAKGSDFLHDCKLKSDAPTVRTVATCCNSAMLVDFCKGHWLSLHRARFVGPVPPLQMRIQTKFAPDAGSIPPDVPCYRTFPFSFITRLLAAKVGMLFGR